MPSTELSPATCSYRGLRRQDEDQGITCAAGGTPDRRPLLRQPPSWSPPRAGPSRFSHAGAVATEFGARICRSYVISMLHTVSDLLESGCCWRKEAGLSTRKNGQHQLLVVPLFETVEDLQRAPQ